MNFLQRAHTYVEDRANKDDVLESNPSLNNDTVGSNKIQSQWEIRRSIEGVVSIEDSQVRRFRENIDLVGEDSQDDTRE